MDTLLREKISSLYQYAQDSNTISPYSSFAAKARDENLLQMLLDHEKNQKQLAEGDLWLVGVDEVGRGPLAGPVIACALALKQTFLQEEFWQSPPLSFVQDSKKLSSKRRKELLEAFLARDLFQREDLRVALYSCSAQSIDQKNIHQATLGAMGSALKECLQGATATTMDLRVISQVDQKKIDSTAPKKPKSVEKEALFSIEKLAQDHSATLFLQQLGSFDLRASSHPQISPSRSLLLVDGRFVPSCALLLEIYGAFACIKGDAKSATIALASIFAKVVRDEMMCLAAKSFPQYGWERNAGYGTKEHLAALEREGATPLHRKSFAPLAQIDPPK